MNEIEKMVWTAAFALAIKDSFVDFCPGDPGPRACFLALRAVEAYRSCVKNQLDDLQIAFGLKK